MLKPHLHEQFFLDKFALTRCVDGESLTNFPCQGKSGMLAFPWQGKIVKSEICSCRRTTRKMWQLRLLLIFSNQNLSRETCESSTWTRKPCQWKIVKENLLIIYASNKNWQVNFSRNNNCLCKWGLSIWYSYYPTERTTHFFNYYILLGKRYIFVQRLELKTLSFFQFLQFVMNRIIIQIKSYFTVKRSNEQVLFCMETVPFSVRKV